MAFELVKNIVEAEKEVDSIKNQAKLKAETIKAEAKNRAQQMLADVKVNAKSLQLKMADDAFKESELEVHDIIAKAQQQCQEIESASQLKRADAVKAVIGKVVKIDGDS